MSTDIRVKRIYDDYDESDGCRVLVDRLWPRGISKEKARLDEWLKEVAPSTKLRKWYHNKEGDWEAFKSRYQEELQGGKQKEALAQLEELVNEEERVTLLYASKDRDHNHALILLDYLE